MLQHDAFLICMYQGSIGLNIVNTVNVPPDIDGNGLMMERLAKHCLRQLKTCHQFRLQCSSPYSSDLDLRCLDNKDNQDGDSEEKDKDNKVCNMRCLHNDNQGDDNKEKDNDNKVCNKHCCLLLGR